MYIVGGSAIFMIPLVAWEALTAILEEDGWYVELGVGGVFLITVPLCVKLERGYRRWWNSRIEKRAASMDGRR